MTDEEKTILLKLLPWLNANLKDYIIQPDQPTSASKDWVKPTQPFGLSHHPGLTFGDLDKVRQLLLRLNEDSVS